MVQIGCMYHIILHFEVYSHVSFPFKSDLQSGKYPRAVHFLSLFSFSFFFPGKHLVTLKMIEQKIYLCYFIKKMKNFHF